MRSRDRNLGVGLDRQPSALLRSIEKRQEMRPGAGEASQSGTPNDGGGGGGLPPSDYSDEDGESEGGDDHSGTPPGNVSLQSSISVLVRLTIGVS